MGWSASLRAVMWLVLTRTPETEKRLDISCHQGKLLFGTAAGNGGAHYDVRLVGVVVKRSSVNIYHKARQMVVRLWWGCDPYGLPSLISWMYH